MFTNLFQLLTGLGADLIDEAGQAAEAVVERANRTIGQLKLAIAIPFLLFLLAMLIGGFGQSESADAAARTFMDLAALVAVALYAMVSFNATMIGQFVALGSLALHKVSAGKIGKIEPAKALEFSRGIIGALAWLVVMCLGGMVFPLWRSVHGTVLLTIGAAALAGMAISWGMKPVGIKYIASGFTVAAMLLGMAQLQPDAKHYLDALSGNAFARVGREAKELDEQRARIVAGEPEPAVVETDTAAEKLPTRVAPGMLGSGGNAPNANAAPPSLTGSDEAPANEPTVDGESQADSQETAKAQEPPKPRVPGKVAKQIDDLYGDLL